MKKTLKLSKEFNMFNGDDDLNELKDIAEALGWTGECIVSYGTTNRFHIIHALFEKEVEDDGDGKLTPHIELFIKEGYTNILWA